jgi:hypothetical protein
MSNCNLHSNIFFKKNQAANCCCDISHREHREHREKKFIAREEVQLHDELR